MAETNRRAVDKATSLPSITIGFALLILAGTWVLSQRTQQYTSAIESLSVLIEDVRQRQGKYIGQGGVLTQQISEARAREIERCIWIAVRLNDDSVPCT